MSALGLLIGATLIVTTHGKHLTVVPNLDATTCEDARSVALHGLPVAEKADKDQWLKAAVDRDRQRWREANPAEAAECDAERLKPLNVPFTGAVVLRSCGPGPITTYSESYAQDAETVTGAWCRP